MPTHPTENYLSVRVVVNGKNGHARQTYAWIEHGGVKAMAVFVSVDQIEGEGCCQAAMQCRSRTGGGAGRLTQRLAR